MMGNLVITIGRECGSAGRLIGQKLAADLGVKCYDKELLTLAAKNSGLCEELFKTHDEKPTSSFLYSLVMDTYSLGYNTSAYMDMPINHKIFSGPVRYNQEAGGGRILCHRRPLRLIMRWLIIPIPSASLSAATRRIKSTI